MRIAVVGGLLCLLSSPIAAQDAAAVRERRTLRAEPLGAEEAMSVNGRLDEPIWQRAVPAADFRQQEPDNGNSATERTEVRAIFDSNRLILGVICYDDPAGLMANTLQRDEPFASGDKFQWTIDTFLNGRSGYFFEINPAGAMGDGLIVAGTTSVNKQWDGIWNLKVQKTEIGWTAEIELPFRTFNFDPNSSTWGINFQRSIRRKEEESLWMGHARNQGLRRMTNAGLLTGLTGLTQGVGLDVKPYVVATADAAPGRGEPGTRLARDVGVDVFYNVTPGLRANLTVNTDFAQTEVDQRLVNLTRFPLFFPDKRDFFVEGAAFFDFAREPDNSVLPFFSRRIGLDEDGQPQAVDVGAKLTGQYGAQDIGFFQVRTGAQDDAPAEDFTVARVKRRLLRQSYVGGVYTRRDAALALVTAEQTVGMDFLLATSSFAGTQNLELSGFALRTSDVNRVGRSHAYGLRLEYPNDRWSGGFAFRELSEGYAPAVGFAPRTGYRRYNPRVLFSARPVDHPWFRRISAGADADLQTDMRNDGLTRVFNLTVVDLEWQSTDTLTMKVVPTYERLESDFRIVDGIVLPAAREYHFTRYNVALHTSSGRPVELQVTGETGRFYDGNREDLSVSVTVRPRLGVMLTLDGIWNQVELAQGRFNTRVYRAIGRTQFSPFISVVNTVQYDSISAAIGWQSRLRWIMRPGNDFYFAYTHNWQEGIERFATLDRRAATKITYTHRF
jgi:hypothetical protein